MGSFKLRMHQNPFSAGAPPCRPRWGAYEYDAPSDPLVGWGGGRLLSIPFPLDAVGVSISPPSPFF